MQITDPQSLYGAPVVGADGNKLGDVEQIFVDAQTQLPEWASVKTRRFGNKISLVPLSTAEQDDEGIRLPYDRAKVMDAPHFDVEHGLSVDEEAALFRHYGVPYGGETATAQVGEVAAPRRGGTRSGSEEAGSGEEPGPAQDPARLTRYDGPRHASREAPASHEEVRVERESMTGAGTGGSTDADSPQGGAVFRQERTVVTVDKVDKSAAGDDAAHAEGEGRTRRRR